MDNFWDYLAISEQIDRGVAGVRGLTSATIVLCLSALTEMEYKARWDAIDDDDYDDIEAMLAKASQELLTPYTCSESSDVKKAVLTYEKGEGLDGASITADSDTVVPLNTEYDPFSIVTLTGSNFITPISGIWHVEAQVSLYDTTKSKLWLLDQGDEILIQGLNRDNEDHHGHLSGIFECDGETGFYLVVHTNSAQTFGRAYDLDMNEVYAQMTLTWLGESE